MDRSLSRACRTTEVRSTDTENVSPHENARPILNERDIINELNNILTVVEHNFYGIVSM